MNCDTIDWNRRGRATRRKSARRLDHSQIVGVQGDMVSLIVRDVLARRMQRGNCITHHTQAIKIQRNKSQGKTSTVRQGKSFFPDRRQIKR